MAGQVMCYITGTLQKGQVAMHVTLSRPVGGARLAHHRCVASSEPYLRSGLRSATLLAGELASIVRPFATQHSVAKPWLGRSGKTTQRSLTSHTTHYWHRQHNEVEQECADHVAHRHFCMGNVPSRRSRAPGGDWIQDLTSPPTSKLCPGPWIDGAGRRDVDVGWQDEDSL